MKGEGERAAIQGFEDLEVFKKAYQVSLEIHRASLGLPRHEQVNGLADQMRRASKGICANIAEGYGKQRVSKAEFKRYLQIAIGSADEMRVWLRYCLDLGYIEPASWQRWREQYQIIAKMLTGLHHSWGERC
jgi:four helix bundle protein